MATLKVDPARRFALSQGLGAVLDATLSTQLDERIEAMKAEVKNREISDATRHVFVAFGWLLSGAAADPRCVEIPAPTAEKTPGPHVVLGFDGKAPRPGGKA